MSKKYANKVNEKLVIFLRDQEHRYAFSTLSGDIMYEDMKFPTLDDAVNFAEENGISYFIA